MIPLLISMRPTQWAKNVFVLAPVVFARALGDPETLQKALLAFAAFCAAASAIYLINDIRDREEDRKHPHKRNRPLAKGTLSVPTAIGGAAVLAASALGAALTLGTAFTLFLAGYLVLNTFYSIFLKHVVIVDVMTIALGFVLRVMAGGAAIGVAVSSWLLLCTIFLALFLAFSKRRHELQLLASEAAGQRRVLSHYSEQFLDQMINVVTASSVVSYALYAVAPETVERYGGNHLVYTMPLVLFGIFRYLYLIYQRPSEKNPTEGILRDLPFLTNIGIFGLVVLWIVYG